ASVLSVSVVAESADPPTLAIAAAFAFAATSPVSGVSGVRAGFVAVVPVVVPAFEVDPAPRATVAARPQATRATAPIEVFQRLFVIDVLSRVVAARRTKAPRSERTIGIPWALRERNRMQIR